MNDERDITVAFTGHRNYDGCCDEALINAVRRFYERGFRIFMTGMAAGFDLVAGECVASLKGELKDLQLRCIVPFAGHRNSMGASCGWRYDRLIEAADMTVTLSPRYDARVYHMRNDYLVNNASAVIAYFDGQSGGTEYTVRKALASGLEVNNLWLGLFTEVLF